jgi:hypothetical protein
MLLLVMLCLAHKIPDRLHQPEYFYTNRYLSLIERELFN